MLVSLCHVSSAPLVARHVAGRPDTEKKVTTVEQLLLAKLDLLHGDAPSEPNSLLQILASCRALVFNPASSEATIRSVFDALARFLCHERRPFLLRPAIKLLGDAALLHRALLPPAVVAARPLLACGERLAAEALSFLVAVAGSGGEGLSLVRSVLDERLVLSLASSRVVGVRSMLVKLLVLHVDRGSAGSFTVGQLLLVLRVLLGLTADLYPSVRSAALGGLLVLCVSAAVEIDLSVLQASYDVAVALLRDVDTSVRISAIRLVSELGGFLAASQEGGDNSGCSDAQFLLLCFFARDMDMKVRTEVLVALGKVKFVSEYILLQSLSKKVLRSDNRGKLLAKCNEGACRPSLSCAAGVFVHGLADEFYEVRRAACNSLGILAGLSAKFADNALDFLMDMLNDDSATVQLETLRTLTQMAMRDNLSVPEKHMHMLLGALANNGASIRCAARKVIQLMKFSEMELFRLSISEILVNLETYPEDEEDVLKVLFGIGKTHGELAASIMKEYVPEIESLGELNLDRPRVAALLVFALSPVISSGNLSYDIPARIASYVIPLLGRISRSLQGFMSQDTILAYLCNLSGLPYLRTEPNSDEEQMEESEATLNAKLAITASGQILRTVTETWPMIKMQRTQEVLKTLRACQEELGTIEVGVNATSRACLVFTLEYVQVIQLIAEIWEKMQPKDPRAVKMRYLDLLLEKLEISLRTMRYCFMGLSKEEESHVVELTLLGCVLRLLKDGIWADPLVRKMWFMISHLELIHGEAATLSVFVRELKSLLCSQCGMNYMFSCTRISDLLECFSLKQMKFSGRIRHTKAELEVLNEDSEHPFPFVPGLPVGITFNITLYNVSKDHRVWLRMAVGESIQYSFLNLSQFDSSDFERRFIVNIPFFGTPKAAFFLLKACVCLECTCEVVTQKTEGQGGPRCEVVFLCDEKDVYLADVGKIKYES